MEQVNKWKALCGYLRYLGINSEVSRQELLSIFDKLGEVPPRRYMQDTSTVDNYRALLTRVKILSMIEPGLYKIEALPKKDLTLQRVREILKKPTWEKWFRELELFEEITDPD